MKKKIIIALLATLSCYVGYTQDSPEAKATLLAHRAAQRMQDGLNLSPEQRLSLFQINMNLHREKMAKRVDFAGNDSLITFHLQRAENKRDSLYMNVLPPEKFLLYKQMKKNLIGRGAEEASAQ